MAARGVSMKLWKLASRGLGAGTALERNRTGLLASASEPRSVKLLVASGAAAHPVA